MIVLLARHVHLQNSAGDVAEAREVMRRSRRREIEGDIVAETS
jgi:hypothetical protein